MADIPLRIPSGISGIMRYSDEFESKIILKPQHVITIIVIIAILTIGLRLFF